jgi:mannose-1-phosphate guanylyltransferase
MRAIIMAGGKGTRLGPVCRRIPKPLVPVGDHAIVEILIRQLAACGFAQATLTLSHCGRLLAAYFADQDLGLALDFFSEPTPLGTMGALCLLPDLPEHVLVVNGDTLTDLDFGALIGEHLARGAALTVATNRRRHVVDFGAVTADGDGMVTAFAEKPALEYEAAMGCNVISAAAIRLLSRDEPAGFDTLLLACLREGLPVRAHRHAGYWRDIGRPEDYQLANEEFAAMRDTLLPEVAHG